jgi:hypothetical protein
MNSLEKSIEYKMELIPIDTTGNPHLPKGAKAYRVGNCTIIYTIDDGRHHISIANLTRYPTWEELKFVRYALVPDEVPMGIILPSKSIYVNIHKNCFHLWEIKDNFPEWSVL